MLTLQVLVHFLMMCVWWIAATVGGVDKLRWVLLAVAIPVTLLSRSSSLRGTRLPVGWGVLLALGVYGTVIAPLSPAPEWALAKCVAFAASTTVFMAGGVSLVERFGRDRVLGGWRVAWRALLLYSVLVIGSGGARSGPEGLYGFTGNPNMYGSILLGFGLILTPARQNQSRLWRALELGGGAALLLATRSRASLAAALVAAGVAVFLHRGRSGRLWAGVICVATVVVLVAQPDQTLRQLSNTAEGGSVSEILRSRAQNWSDSWDGMLAGMPLGLGWGIKAGQKQQGEQSLTSTYHGREEGTSWLPIGEELGLPGFILFALLWAAMFRAAAGCPPGVRALAGATLAAYFVLATFEAWLLSPGNWETAWFWTTMGIILARPSTAIASPARSAKPPPSMGAAA